MAKAMASPGLEWQERREAGFTEQRSLPASNGGRITGRCTMGPLGPRDPLQQTTIRFSFLDFFFSCLVSIIFATKQVIGIFQTALPMYF